MKVKLLSDKATLPTRNNPTDAGLDLYSAEDHLIPSGKGQLIKTNIAIALPENTVGMVCDRSGNGKKGLKVHGGIVDVDYRGDLGVILWNHTGADYSVKVGDRIAQLLVIPLLFPIPELAESLDDTNRGDKGFGSSGV